MDQLPGTWLALCALAFTLGARHGFDPDHLATIDGLARHNSRDDPRLARLAGAFFSLGHGAVVLLVAAAAAAFAFATPAWLETTGVSVSVVFLFGLAFANVRAVMTADPRTVVAPAGVKSRLLARFIRGRSAWAIAGVGMLFALSFDTISLAALFALAAAKFGGTSRILFVAGLFVLGMLIVDGANGAWISRLVLRADRTAVVASRVMALTVAGVSAAVGLLALVKLLIPAVETWAEGRELVVGACVIAAVFAGFALSMRMARRRAEIATA